MHKKDVKAIELARDRYLLQLKQINDILHPEDDAQALERPKTVSAEVLRCSFCCKDQNNVEKLIAGPAVFICDECVRVCVEILAEKPPAKAVVAGTGDAL